MNPLAFFRRYQKAMLAVAAVGAMLAFGILPIVSDWQNQSAGGPSGGYNADAGSVSWAGMSLSEDEIMRLRQIREQANQFQVAVARTAIDRGAEPRSLIVPRENGPANVIESAVLAQQAEKMGVTVGDEAVLRHLTQSLADGAIDRNEMAAILKNTTQLTQQQLFDTFKTELSAHQMRLLANGASFGGEVSDAAVTPGQAFDYFRRLYRRMQAEVIAVPVEDFVDKVTEEPSDTEVRELYDEYKDVFPSQVRPTPGFREPGRVAFQWVKADFPSLLEREIAKVTDEEIKAKYEEDKESYRKVSLPSTDDLTLPDTEETEALEDLAPNESADGVVVPDEGGTADESSETVEESAESGDEDFDAAPVSQDESSEVSSDQAGDGDAKTTAADSSEATNAAETTAEAAEGDDNGPEEEVVEYQTLEEVRDDIAAKIARPRAADAVKAALEKVRAATSTYFDDYMYWDTTPDEEKGAQPTPPDLQALPNAEGLIYGDIPLISALEADKYELGRAYNMDFSTGQIRQIPFVMMGFSPALPVFKAQEISARDSIESRFVFWKTDQKEAYTPTLDEARPKVVKHWKMKKAIALAKEAAKGYIAKLGNDQSLKTAADAGMFGDDAPSVTETNEFTWMTSGATASGQGRPQMSSVYGVKVPGVQFMTDVSKLESGETSVSMNHPETEVYAVYMKGITGNDDDLRQLFLKEGVKSPVLQMVRQANMESAVDWYSSTEKSLGLDLSSLARQQ